MMVLWVFVCGLAIAGFAIGREGDSQTGCRCSTSQLVCTLPAEAVSHPGMDGHLIIHAKTNLNATCISRQLFRDRANPSPYQNSVDKCGLSPSAFAVKQGFSEVPLALLPCKFSGTPSLSFLPSSFTYVQYIYSSQPSGRLRVRYLETGEVESIVEEMIKSGHCDCEQETIVKWIRGSSIVSSITCSQESGTLIAALDLKGDECSLLARPKHGTIKCFPQEEMWPATCKLECNVGFSMDGVTSLNRTCNQTYGWSAGPLVCSRVNCGGLLAPQFGYLNCSGTEFNDTCTFGCAMGYSLTGSIARRCESDGNWSGKAVNCSHVVCPEISVNNSNGCQQLLYGSTCTVRCTPGYVVSYETTELEEFELSCTAHGDWTNSTLACSPLLCAALPPPLNGYSNCSYRNTLEIIHKYSYLTACSFSCNNGYLLNGSSIRVCEGPIGAWSGLDSVCTPVTCDTALEVANAQATCSSTKCQVDCDTGYRATYLNGTSSTSYESTCNASGLWDGVMPCKLITCIQLSPVGNGTITCTRNNTFSSLCRYHCQQAFSLDGNLFRTCEASGLWTGSEPKCIERRECSALISNSSDLQAGQVNGDVQCPFGRRYGDSCTVVCPFGYSLVIGGQRLCHINGTWSSEDTRCEEYDLCKLAQDNCHIHADCYSTGRRGFRCFCVRGYAGNGVHCGLDPDADFYPSSALPGCVGRYCQQDNCNVTVPNSGQEDTDGDGKGNSCDTNDDNDGVNDDTDNCPLLPNSDQSDMDGDSVGDSCDNCRMYWNSDQQDADGDGIGNICDSDADNDTVVNGTDNCVLVFNANQTDSDSDGVGDACDNCVHVVNIGQEDADENGVGDACDSSVDIDRDGHIDDMDNCPSIINSDQLDTDGDGLGDACDMDDDNDGVMDKSDDCPLLSPNPGNSTHPCSNDDDGDGILNSEDACPLNKYVLITDFSDGITVSLDPHGDVDPEPVWKIQENGEEIILTDQSDPALVVSKQWFGYMEYSGTFYIALSDLLDDDYLGFVFSYQSNRKFYAFLWKRQTSAYFGATGSQRPVGIAGMQLKVIDSITGPGTELRNALWHTGSVVNQTRMLWWSNTSVTWGFKTSYQWLLVHNPANGYIRLKWFEGAQLLVDTGHLYDTTFRGGRVGVLVFSQDHITFSALQYRCLENRNYALSFNRNSKGVTLGTYDDLGLIPYQNFSIGAWIFLEQCNSVTCTFEKNNTFGTDCTNVDLGMFSQIADYTEDDFDWFFESAGTPSSGTGPSFDHTGNNGCYAHIEATQASNHRVFEGARASLETVCFPSSTNCSMSFWYHMYDDSGGSHIGSLEVEVKDSIYSWYPVFYIAGNQGDMWHNATVDLSGFSGSIKVRITARFGSSYKSDIAIDDIVLSDGCGRADLCEVTKPIFGSDSSNGGFGLMLKNDEIVAEISGMQYHAQLPVKPLWQFVSLSYNSSTRYYEWCVYGDTSKCGGLSRDGYDSYDGITNLLLGIQGANSLSSAWLDEIRIYGDGSGALENYNSYLQYDQVPTLRAYWKLNGGEGQLISDKVGMRDTALPSGGPQWQPSSLRLTGK